MRVIQAQASLRQKFRVSTGLSRIHDCYSFFC
nr:MAG TPA: hypothetical protein [Caudoviricetes sp.]